LVSTYLSVVNPPKYGTLKTSRLEKSQTFESFFKDIYAKKPDDTLFEQMFSRYVVGADLTDQNHPIARFSTAAFHAGPLSLNIMLNTQLKMAFPDKDFSIVFRSHPIRFREEV
jgi:hypothetical protein